MLGARQGKGNSFSVWVRISYIVESYDKEKY